MTSAIGIIGAGPAGLSAAVVLKAAGLPFEAVDAGNQVGGIWDINRTDTPMYDAAHFISSRTQSGFAGFPMPEHYPDYPRHDQILAYIQDYARHHQLEPCFRMQTRVVQARRETAGWCVTFDTGETRQWSSLIVATGTTWHPNTPSVPGHFDGEQMHSVGFRSPEVFRGKRVLVVGGGNSGADIACEAARHAARAFISLRRGYHFVPKHIFGTPADVFAHRGPQLPARLEEVVFGFLLDKVLVGDLARFGLPRPDHPILRSHPIMNTQILHHLSHGDLEYRPDVRELSGGVVRFVDGREETIDLIVWATGYQRRFPFLEEQGGASKLDLYLELFHRTDPALAFMGLFETDGAAYRLLGLQASAVSAYLKAKVAAPEAAARFDRARLQDRPDLHGGRRYVDSMRHAYYVRSEVYAKALEAAVAALR